jgi:CRP-like cAMP-binding protein
LHTLSSSMISTLLFKNLNKYALITQDHFAVIESVIIKRSVKKKRTVLVEGDICRYLYFVEKGALRSYTTDKEGAEHVVQLVIEDHWVADLSGFITQTPGKVNIETIEDSELLLLPYLELENLLEKIPALERYFRNLYQRAYVALQQRYNSAMRNTAEDRYRLLITESPQIATRIPLIFIASYLGITPESLSRIRKQVFIR